ncbi:hypothetical protein [Candidatus Laterigemmans baculatus]|uniref:hypothetical protein n=1 Tax=Candidatus Laterigemmans baculatus TaxID=2770505 RepID=UPI0013DA9553|nr:hypothetical protein [Candidatus Laterigemmans baculatus]
MRTFSFSVLALLTATTLGLSVVGCGTLETPTASEAETDAADVTMVSFANKSCPIMGGDLDTELTRQWNGKTVGFCCDGCPEDWDALSEEEKAEKFAEASEAEGHDHGDHDHGDHDHDHAPASEAAQGESQESGA